MPDTSDEHFMTLAIEKAKTAFLAGEVPVGAVVVAEGEIIGSGYNTRESRNDPLGHAEVTAIRDAAKSLDRWRLQGASLYVTLEPCVMCAGALILSRIERLVFGAVDPKGGAVCSLYRILEDPRMNHRVLVRGGILEKSCQKLLKDFFRSLRAVKQ